MKAKALKEQTTASRPIKALTVYPLNTPTTLVPRVLPTKSQVKINIFALIQFFLEFEKICNKRITPTGLTEEERGFEQTKEYYLTEVIPFFKTLKEHFDSIQKALTKEIKEMKEIFEELEAEVNQNVVNRKYDEIERKNLLIENDNLIADCLSKEVFYIATNSELTVSRFTEMHDAHTVVQSRCLELEAELSKLHDKVQKDDHTELVKRFSNLEITRAKHIEQTTALLTENENLKAQLHENMKCITMDSIKPRVLAPGRYAIDVEPIPPRSRNNREVHLDYLKHLKESVETLCEIVEEAKVERPLDRSLASACLYTKHSQELLEYVIGTCPKDFNKRDKKHASTPLTRKKQVTFEDQLNSCTDASRSKPRSNTKKNRISPAKSVNKKKVEEHPRTNKSSLKNTNRVDSSISSKRKVLTNVGYQWKPTGRIFTLGEQCPLSRLTTSSVLSVQQTKNVSTSKPVITEKLSNTSQKSLTSYQRRNKQYKAIPTLTVNQVVQIVLWYLEMTGDRSRIRNFMKKFIGTVRFGNNNFGAIMGYEDYVIGGSVIFRVYYVEGLGHNLFSVRQFCDSDLEVAFRKHSCYVRDTDGVDLIKALNVDSLKADLVFIQNTCSEKEESNLETASSKSVKECSLNSETKDVYAIKYKMSKAKERCMEYFRSLHSHLQVLSKGDSKGTRIEHGFKQKFMSLFGQEVDTFTTFWVVNNQFEKFINSKFTLDYDSQMTDTYFVEYTGIKVQHFRDTLLQHLESKIDTGKALDADLVDTESIRIESEVQDDSSRSGNDTDADDADIRPIYDEEPMEASKPLMSKGRLVINSSGLKPQSQMTVCHKRKASILNVNWRQIHVSSDPDPQCSTTVLEQDSLSPGPQRPENVPQVAETVTTSNELELFIGPVFQ
ncbi:hypothetical protein Tco_1031913 [Tanacetum coccineum]|uniref:Integrase, catalytic region, zinc finger, CCHC-type, peptidase aspartic, catalytic n=1 Tax=Tanacetum coccineum TaxID=301880 RepID=A0ABQ5GCD5_9ASTR